MICITFLLLLPSHSTTISAEQRLTLYTPYKPASQLAIQHQEQYVVVAVIVDADNITAAGVYVCNCAAAVA